MRNEFGFCLFLLCLMEANPILGAEVIVASQSESKTSAVSEAFSETFPNEEIRITAYPAPSGIAEQPVGKSSALIGASNRIQNLPEELLARSDYVVAIENYIEEENGWVDRAVILLHSPSGKTAAHTSSTEIPDFYVAHALAENLTVGQSIRSSFPDRQIDPQDWHKEPEFGGVSRKQRIKDSLFKMLHQEEIGKLKALVALHPDFPKPGILFQDFSPILRNPEAFRSCIDLLAKRAASQEIEVVVGLESRGFLIGAALAYRLQLPFVPVRKAGKIPGAVLEVSYEKEYGSDTFAIAEGAIAPEQRVLIVDDLIATGGSARAGIELISLSGGNPVEFVSLLEIPELEGAKTLNIPTFNLID